MAKTYNDTETHDLIVSLENIAIASLEAEERKKAKRAVIRHRKNRIKEVCELYELAHRGEYITGKYKEFQIRERKSRVISALDYYPHRIMQRAICRVLDPIFFKKFTDFTYACIPKRGVHKCMIDVKKDLKRDADGTLYCLKIDIRHYFQSINQRILIEIIGKTLGGWRMMRMAKENVNSFPEGIPIGSRTSQLWANVYLNGLDHWMKEELKIKHCYRYMDDIVVLAHTKEELHSFLWRIRNYCFYMLDLDLKSNYQIFRVEDRGLDFVGYRFFHDRVIERKDIMKKTVRKAHKLAKRGIRGKAFDMELASNMGWMTHTGCSKLKNDIRLLRYGRY